MTPFNFSCFRSLCRNNGRCWTAPAEVCFRRAARCSDSGHLPCPSWRKDAAGYPPPGRTCWDSALGSEETCSGTGPSASESAASVKAQSAGYLRTVTTVYLKLRRMHLSLIRASIQQGLDDALGIDSHVVTRRNKAGHLRAQFRGTKRTEQQGGDIYLICEKDVRRFILQHPPRLTCAKSTSCGSWI